MGGTPIVEEEISDFYTHQATYVKFDYDYD